MYQNQPASFGGSMINGLQRARFEQEAEQQRQNRLAEASKQQPQQAAGYNALAAYGGPTREAAQSLNPPSQMGAMIAETAAELGMDPIDLATIISYETGGTFDPTQAGPTTQWGQHRGLIQFGEPQAREYGVNWDDPLNSQLGREGAVVRYFRRNGWQPGMGMLDAYSIVNAGGPGLHNRSDANNGGAPGTVADKVRDQMGGHRRNAMRLLGA